MYNLFLKHNNSIYCAAVRKGGKPGLNIKINNKIYNIMTTADTTTKLKYKLNNVAQNILYKTPGLFVYRIYGNQKAITFFGGSYQIITPDKPISYFISTAGLFLSIIVTQSVWQTDVIYYSYNGEVFMQKQIGNETITDAIINSAPGNINKVSFDSADDDGNGGLYYAFCAESVYNGTRYYTYARVHLNNIESEPVLIDVSTYNHTENIYYKPGELRNPVNGWYKISQNEYSNPDTHEIATLPDGNGELIYDPISQYYYLITRIDNNLWLKNNKDLIYGEWSTIEDLGYDSTGPTYRAIESSDLP